jgi:hypothetical protein
MRVRCPRGSLSLCSSQATQRGVEISREPPRSKAGILRSLQSASMTTESASTLIVFTSKLECRSLNKLLCMHESPFSQEVCSRNQAPHDESTQNKVRLSHYSVVTRSSSNSQAPRRVSNTASGKDRRLTRSQSRGIDLSPATQCDNQRAELGQLGSSNPFIVTPLAPKPRQHPRLGLPCRNSPEGSIQDMPPLL